VRENDRLAFGVTANLKKLAPLQVYYYHSPLDCMSNSHTQILWKQPMRRVRDEYYYFYYYYYYYNYNIHYPPKIKTNKESLPPPPPPPQLLLLLAVVAPVRWVVRKAFPLYLLVRPFWIPQAIQQAHT